MNINFYPKIVLKCLLYLILFLLCANILGIMSEFYFDDANPDGGLIRLFDFDTESNIPTFYSSLALLLVSTLLSFIALTHKKLNTPYLPWIGLAIIFLFLSIDEFSKLHESLIEPLKVSLNTSGLLYYSWVIPYGIALIIFVIAYIKFLAHLPRSTMIMFVVSGVIFVTGAIGVEMVGGRHIELYSRNNLLYTFYYTCEELLEMLGIALFIYTLLTYIVRQFKFFTITITQPM